MKITLRTDEIGLGSNLNPSMSSTHTKSNIFSYPIHGKLTFVGR